MGKNANSHCTKSQFGKLRDLAGEMRSFACNMRRDDSDARDSTRSPYADALDGFAATIDKLTPPK